MLAIIILLASTYLQLHLSHEQLMIIGPDHNVADTGLVLFLVFLVKEISSHGIVVRGTLQRITFYFIVFLLLNGIYDIIIGTSLGDIVKYLRRWAYLLIVFVVPRISLEEIYKALQIIFWITFGISVVLIAQYIFGQEWIGHTLRYIGSDGIAHVRGAKPPSYNILCTVLAVTNFFGLDRKWQVITAAVIFMPILLMLKMTYFVSVLLILLLYYVLFEKQNFGIFAKRGILFLLFALTLNLVFPVFNQRFGDVLQERHVITNSNQEGNFAFRIKHLQERYSYVVSNPVRAIRGIGYIQEQNYHQYTFKIGLLNRETGKVIQLDTGDIAWSLLIVRLGLLGIILYLIFYGRCLKELYERVRRSSIEESKIESILICYMAVSLLFMSWGNAIIASSDYFIFSLLIIVSNENSTLYLESLSRRSGTDAD